MMEHGDHKEASSITINYKDETSINLEKGLVAFMPDAETVIMRVCNLTGPEVVTVLASFQGVLGVPPDQVETNH